VGDLRGARGDSSGRQLNTTHPISRNGGEGGSSSGSDRVPVRDGHTDRDSDVFLVLVTPLRVNERFAV
jgi:hypothetical protein